MKTIICQRCGKTFTGHGNCKFCDECGLKRQRERQREYSRKWYLRQKLKALRSTS